MEPEALVFSRDPALQLLIDVVSQRGESRTAEATVVIDPPPQERINLSGYFSQRPLICLKIVAVRRGPRRWQSQFGNPSHNSIRSETALMPTLGKGQKRVLLRRHWTEAKFNLRSKRPFLTIGAGWIASTSASRPGTRVRGRPAWEAKPCDFPPLLSFSAVCFCRCRLPMRWRRSRSPRP